MRNKMFILGFIGALASASLSYGGGSIHSAQTIDVNNRPALKDLAENSVCDWRVWSSYKDDLNLLQNPDPKKRNIMKEILSSIREVHWYLAQVLEEEMNQVEICLTEKLRQLPSDDLDGVTVITVTSKDLETKNTTRQLAIRFNQQTFIDTKLLEELPYLHPQFAFVHEISHSLFPLNAPRRISKVKSFILALYKNHLKRSDADSLAVNMRANQVNFIPASAPLDRYRKEIETVTNEKAPLAEREIAASTIPDEIRHLLWWRHQEVIGKVLQGIQTKIANAMRESKPGDVIELLRNQPYLRSKIIEGINNSYLHANAPGRFVIAEDMIRNIPLTSEEKLKLGEVLRNAPATYETWASSLANYIYFQKGERKWFSKNPQEDLDFLLYKTLKILSPRSDLATRRAIFEVPDLQEFVFSSLSTNVWTFASLIASTFKDETPKQQMYISRYVTQLKNMNRLDLILSREAPIRNEMYNFPLYKIDAPVPLLFLETLFSYDSWASDFLTSQNKDIEDFLWRLTFENGCETCLKKLIGLYSSPKGNPYFMDALYMHPKLIETLLQAERFNVNEAQQLLKGSSLWLALTPIQEQLLVSSGIYDVAGYIPKLIKQQQIVAAFLKHPRINLRVLIPSHTSYPTFQYPTGANLLQIAQTNRDSYAARTDAKPQVLQILDETIRILRERFEKEGIIKTQSPKKPRKKN